MGVRRLWLLATLLVAAGSLSAYGSTGSKRLVLDRSIGPVRLKESRKRIEEDIGKGRLLASHVDRSARPSPVRQDRIAYEGEALVVIYISDKDHAPIAFVIETTSPRYRTVSGIGVGSSLAKLRKVGVECFGETLCQHFHGHNKPGTLFRLTAPRGRVAKIDVIASVD